MPGNTVCSEIKFIDLVAYLADSRGKPGNRMMDSHIHNKCEIYVNLTGKVSFMVENRIYNIQSGDVVITRPYEAHHCIYHDSSAHEHFCINFSPNHLEEILDVFLKRNTGEENLISLPKQEKEKLINLCNTLVQAQSGVERYIAFFSVIELLSCEKHRTSGAELSPDVKTCIDFINENLSRQITVRELADISHVTVNTLERHFKTYIGISPYTYMQNCRLAMAVDILENGGTVTQAADDSGFADYSHFIALFKKRYGKTPLQFKKEL